MMHYENYRWEDHVPRKGSWKLNLAVGALVCGLIAATCPGSNDDSLAAAVASRKPAADVTFAAVDLAPRSML